MKKLIVLLMILSVQTLCSQADPIKSLNEIITSIRTGYKKSVDASPIYTAKNKSAVLDKLEIFSQDTLPQVRLEVIRITSQIGVKSDDKDVRTKALNLIANGLSDKESSIAIQCAKALQGFNSGDFSSESKLKIRNAVKAGPALSQVARLAGFAGDKNYIQNLTGIYSSSSTGKREKLHIQLALARLGVDSMSANLLSRAKKSKINDDFVYNVVPDLVYMRNREAMIFLFDIIDSDSKNCISANSDSDEKMVCAFRVIEMIAPAIKDFPVKLDDGGDLITKNYDETLQVVRNWIQTNKTSFTLNTDIF